jgi:hypothetical protein
MNYCVPKLLVFHCLIVPDIYQMYFQKLKKQN